MTALPPFAAALALCLAACTPEPAEGPEAAPETRDAAAPPAAAPAPPPETPTSAAANLLTPAGLGALRIGQPVPSGSGWAERGAQIPGECRTITSPDFPGAHAIVEGGIVRRISIGERSDLEVAQGIGPGASEAQVRAAFPGFTAEPHKYVEAPAKYLTAPDAGAGKPALRFEIGADGKVGLVHAGTMPVLGYVEGCA